MEDKNRISAYKKLIDGIDNIINTGQYEEFLKSMKKFHNYSFRNRVLIFSQAPNATLVAGYCTWKKLGRGVKANPNKILILRPLRCKVKKEIEDKEQEKDDEEEISLIKYGWTIVYDISDTYIRKGAKEIPLLDNTKLNANSSQELYKVLLKVSPVKVDIENTRSGADGYYSKIQNRIVLSPNQSVDDMTATLLHEISHALYDDFDYSKDRDLSEIFVESIAYIVADYFGLNTSKCSFSYITQWSDGDTKKLLKMGTKIQESSDELINRIEEQIKCKSEKIA